MSKIRVDRIENKLGQLGFNVADLTQALKDLDDLALDGAEKLLFDENFDYSEGSIGHRLLGEFFLDRQNHTGIQLASTIGLLTGLGAGSNAAIDAGDNLLQALAKLQAQISAGSVWTSQPIGVPFPIWDHISGAPVPPTNSPLFRYVKLTASDSYNNGVLTSESLSGTIPQIQATASIIDTLSPLNGQTIQLINTERRILRAGSSGTIEQDQVGPLVAETRVVSQSTGANTTMSPRNISTSNSSDNTLTTSTPVTVQGSRTGTETRPKNIGATYYMRIR